MNRALLIIGGLLVGLLATLFVVPLFIDWTRYRGVFEEETTRLLGREVRVGGRVNLRLLPTPYVRFENVRIADVSTSVGEPLFKSEDFTVWLAVGPLLSGGLEASRIELRKPVVSLVLDNDGSGNWSSLATGKSNASFVPSSVALNAVRVTNGTIALFSSDGAPLTSVDHINGEFSAAALEGPYRVSAAFSMAGSPREIRLSTAKSEADGTVRLKGSVRSPANGAIVSLDGQILDLLGKVRVTGDVTAKVPLPQSSAPARTAAAATEPGFDIKAVLKATTSSIELSDIDMSLAQGDRPQQATGNLKLALRKSIDAEVAIRSQWLDLDRIAGNPQTAPLAAVERFMGGLNDLLHTTGRSQIKLDLDQATLGGETVTGLALQLERQNAATAIKTFALTAPGGARVSAQGTVAAAQDGASFDGNLGVRGTSLVRFLKWLGITPSPQVAKRDGAFALSGVVSLGRDKISGRNLAVQYAGNNLTGEAGWSGGASPRIDLALDGPEIDISPLLAESDTPLQALQAALAKLSGVEPKADPKQAAVAAKPIGEGSVRLRIGRFLANRFEARDLGVDLKVSNGILTMPALRFASPEGYAIDVRGDIADVLRDGAKGQLAGAASAQTAAGVQALARVLELPPALQPSAQRSEAMAPLNMAGRVQLGQRSQNQYDVAFDGGMADNRIAGTVRVGADGLSWRDRKWDAAVTAEGRTFERLLKQILPGEPLARGDANAASGTIQVRALGIPKTGLASLVAIDAPGLSGEFRGRVTVSDTADLAVDGEARIATSDLARVAALAGLGRRGGLADVPANGVVALNRSGAKLRFETQRLTIAASPVAGRIEIDGSQTIPKMTGRLELAEFGVPQVLAFVSGSRSVSAGDAATVGGWSDAGFDFGLVEQVEGQVEIVTGNVLLAPGVGLGRGRLLAEAKLGRLDVTLVEASALGGTVVGKVSLERTAAGARGTAQSRLTAGKLDASAGPQPAATGSIALKLDLEGAGASPRGLVAAMKGHGEVNLTAGQLNRMAPSAVRSAAGAALNAKGDDAGIDLRQRLVQALQPTTTRFPARTLAIEVVDGAVRLAPFVVDTPEGRVTGQTAIDLDALKIDSEWRIDGKLAPPPAGAQGKPQPELPPVQLLYVGSLGQMRAIEPRIQIDALAREIGVRRMEREVEELERVRRMDEEQARQETERKRVEAAKFEAQKLEALIETQKLPDARSSPTAAVPVTPAAVPPPSASPASGPASGLGSVPLGGAGSPLAPPPPAVPAPPAGAARAPAQDATAEPPAPLPQVIRPSRSSAPASPKRPSVFREMERNTP